jgi:hypothetical protein
MLLNRGGQMGWERARIHAVGARRPERNTIYLTWEQMVLPRSIHLSRVEERLPSTSDPGCLAIAPGGPS